MKNVVIIAIAAVLAAGCASTPITSAVVKSVARDAERAGWTRVGDVLVPPGIEVPEPKLNGDINDSLQVSIVRKEIADRFGRSEYDVALSLRPWVVRLAQLGDSALAAGVCALVVYGAREVGGAVGGDKNETRIRVSADHGSVVQIGNRDGSSASYVTMSGAEGGGGGSSAPAE